jgi:hypothetical protein
MIAKTINNDKLKEAIKIAFDGDNAITQFYDPHKKIETVDDIVGDVYFKISEFSALANTSQVEIKGLYEKGNLVGYYVFKPSLLISFSVSVQYRTRPYLKAFWGLVKKDLNSRFNCFLWNKNIRARKFLQKMGMEVIKVDNLITQLKCQ